MTVPPKLIQTAGWVCFLLLTLGVNGSVLRLRPTAILELDMSASTDSPVEVFYDLGHGFNPAESAATAIRGQAPSRRLEFAVPAGTLHALRLDPLTLPGRVHLRSAQLVSNSHRPLLVFDLSKAAAFNQIESLAAAAGGELDVQTTPTANDPGILLPLPGMFTASYLPWEHAWHLLAANLSLGLLAAGLAFPRRVGRAASRGVRQMGVTVDAVARGLSHPHFLRFDATGVVFCALCLTAFAAASAAGLHGSSLSIDSTVLGLSDRPHPPLLGTPKGVRNDEWAYHTPAILHQLFRSDPLGAERTPLGPGPTALLSNIPARHFSQALRVNLWPFFLFPPERAFAVYWQMKWLLPELGVFGLLLLLTRSGTVSALGSLWFLFSAHTQWTFSWPSLLPEIVGFACLLTVLTCYLLIGERWACLLAAAVAAAVCAVGLLCCFYVPHQLPLALAGFATVAWWAVSRWPRVTRPAGRRARVTALLGCAAVVVGMLLGTLRDARPALLAAMQTTYPGQRSLSGGGMSVVQFASHFLDFWKSEAQVPPGFPNICEATGFLWLAPLLLLFAPVVPRGRGLGYGLAASRAAGYLWAALGLLAAWTLLPIPAGVARWVLFDKVLWPRCLPAMGLLNVALVGVRLSASRRADSSPGAASAWGRLLRWPDWRFFLCLLAVGLGLGLANRFVAGFFSAAALALAALYAASLVLCVSRNLPGVMAVLLLGPHLWFFGLVNPVDRGLASVTKSPLFDFTQSPEHVRLRQGAWLVFSRWIEPPGFFSAVGCEVVNGLKYVPPLEMLAPFDPQGVYRGMLNQSSYFIAEALAPGQPSGFRRDELNVVHWSVSPLDPGLKTAGVRFLAFDRRPDPLILGDLKPLTDAPVSGFWLYELP